MTVRILARSVRRSLLSCTMLAAALAAASATPAFAVDTPVPAPTPADRVASATGPSPRLSTIPAPIAGISILAAEERRPLGAAGGVLDQFGSEPTVRDVQEVAMKYALVSDDVLNSYSRDAKITKLLPRTRVRYHKDTDDNQTVGVSSAGDRSLSLADNLNSQYDVEMEWRFDELLMGPTRVQAIRETSRLVQLRDDILDEVTKLYFDRRRLQIELLTNPPTDPRARTAKDLRLEELTANLDGLTGGWFGARIRGGKSK